MPYYEIGVLGRQSFGPIGREPQDPVVAGVGNPEVPLRVHCQARRWPTYPGWPSFEGETGIKTQTVSRGHVELATVAHDAGEVGLAPHLVGHRIALKGVLVVQHPVVVRVGHVEVALAVDRHIYERRLLPRALRDLREPTQRLRAGKRPVRKPWTPLSPLQAEWSYPDGCPMTTSARQGLGPS